MAHKADMTVALVNALEGQSGHLLTRNGHPGTAVGTALDRKKLDPLM